MKPTQKSGHREHDGITMPRRGLSVGNLSREQLVLRWRDADGPREASVAEGLVVGSSEAAGIRIADPMVSRLHAELAWRGAVPWIRDLASKNGTIVDGVQVDAGRLRDGSTLLLGSTEVHVAFASKKPMPLWPEERYGPLLGRSEPMRLLFTLLDRVAKSDATALLHGETGTGKELVARAIHEASGRRGGPFVTVDCASIPESLFESELFGHARGAFTGADGAREGAIEAASGGTVFLDEIGELPASMQPKLLRAIEARTIRRVGETEHRPVDVRFIAATHRDLARLVNEGGFREDLYFRLAVLVIEIPPLRARLDDLPLLVRHMQPRDAEPLVPTVLEQLRQQPWLGNVRELRNFVERAVALGTEAALSARPPSQRPSALPAPDIERPFKDVRDEWMAHLEREYLRGWLSRTHGNVSAIAEAIGLDRSYVHRLLRKHDLMR